MVIASPASIKTGRVVRSAFAIAPLLAVVETAVWVAVGSALAPPPSDAGKVSVSVPLVVVVVSCT